MGSASDKGGTLVSSKHPAGTQAHFRGKLFADGESGPKSRLTTHHPFVLLMIEKAESDEGSVSNIRKS